MKYRLRFLLLAIVFLLASPFYAAELSHQTLEAWEQYLEIANQRMQDRVMAKSHFLWVDEDPMRKQRLSGGEVLISPLGSKNPAPVPGGLVHHWIGAVFIPGAGIEDLTGLVSDYGRYSDIYRPTLVKAELLDSKAEEQDFSILWVQRILLGTAAYYTELHSRNVALNNRQGYMTFSATRIQQIENYGGKDERRLAPDEGSGHIWRLLSFARFEERDGGLYLELEVVALSKDLPASLRFFLKPVLDHLPRQMLTTKLEQTRVAIRSRVRRQRSTAFATRTCAADPARGSRIADHE